MLEKLNARFDADANDARIADAARVLFGQAVLAEGGTLEDPAGFATLVTGLLGDVL